MEEGAHIDWIAVKRLSDEGMLMGFLAKLPRHRWAERDDRGQTFLHYACRGPNLGAVVSLIRSEVIDVNAQEHRGYTPAHYAAGDARSRALEMLCFAGADLVARDRQQEYTPIDLALIASCQVGDDAVCALLANGVRLSSACERTVSYITTWLEEFEHGVLRCRIAAVALMHVKRAGKLVRWDKFLLREVAIAVWTTRRSQEWQN